MSNHITFLDIIYHTSTDDFPSYLSKVEILNTFLFGPSAVAFQSIFVDRKNRENRDGVKDAIKKRIKLV